MISLQSSEALVSTVLLFFAYVVSITCAGNFQAYVAKWMGDDTAYSMGFAEFNPFLFIDWLSVVWFILMQVMIGRPVPLELENIKNSYWPVRVFFAFGSYTLFNVFVATAASVIAIVVCDPVTALAGGAIGSASIISSLLKSDSSSLAIVVCMFCGSLVWANLVLAMFSAGRQVVYFFVTYKLQQDYSFIAHADYLIMFGPLLLWYFFGNFIFKMFLYLVGCLVLGITKICGIM